jgi:hypothetical protein
MSSHFDRPETISFTPPSLAALEPAPVFTLRAAAWQEKRQFRRLVYQIGLRNHDVPALRTAVLAGLKAEWTPEAYAEHAPLIEDYWRATDAFAARAASDRAAVWAYDAELEAAVVAITAKVADTHEPLRRLLADNMEFGELSPVVIVAIMVAGWTAVDHKWELEAGHLPIDCASGLRDRLTTLDEQLGHEPMTAWSELTAACADRLFPAIAPAKAPEPTPVIEPGPEQASAAVEAEETAHASC